MKKLLIIMLLLASPAFAADVYMSTTGTKTTGKSVAGDWSNANCYNSLDSAMAAMSGGDTLTIDDGTYTGNENAIANGVFPPNGTDKGHMTVIRARNIPCQNGYSCSSPLKVFFQANSNFTGAIFRDDRGDMADPGIIQYIKFWGIKWHNVTVGQWWDYIYFKQCAFLGMLDGDNAPLRILGQYHLVEDSVVYGKGRYKVLAYDLSRGVQRRGRGYNIFRRVIARNDWAMRNDVSTNPIATFVSYFNRDTAFLNVIDIDSDSPNYWMDSPGEFNGAFSQPVDDGLHRMKVRGSIAINNAMSLGWGASPYDATDSGNEITDVAAVKVAGGINFRGGGTINRLTLVDAGANNFTYRSTTQQSQILTRDLGVTSWDNPVTVTNTILRDIVSTAMDGNTSGNYINTSAVGTVGNTPSNHITTNPLTNGLLYPVRIETGSALATGGIGGGQVGARILNKLGVDGTFQDDVNWDTEQGSLWPWPLESWVKAEMASMPATINGDTMPSATRGFASPTAKQLNGTSDVTLTSYIWESLGNQMPSEIYGEGLVALVCTKGVQLKGAVIRR